MALFGTTAPSVAYDSDYVSSCAQLVLDQKILCVFQPIFLLMLKEIQDSVVVIVGRSFFAFSAIKFYLITICCGIFFLENVQQSLWSSFLMWICLNPMS